MLFFTIRLRELKKRHRWIYLRYYWRTLYLFLITLSITFNSLYLMITVVQLWKSLYVCYPSPLESGSFNKRHGWIYRHSKAHYKGDSAVHLTIPLIIGFSKMLLRNSCISFSFEPPSRIWRNIVSRSPVFALFLARIVKFQALCENTRDRVPTRVLSDPTPSAEKEAQSLPPRPINHGALGSLPRALTSSRGSDPAFDLPLCA